MSVSHLLNATATVYRPNDEPDDWGDPVGPLADMGSISLRIDPQRLDMLDYGPGDQPAGRTRGFIEPGADVQMRDEILVTAGPNEGSRWRVRQEIDASDMLPTAHHTELHLERIA